MKRPVSFCHAEPPACVLFMTSKCNLACAWCRRKKIGTPKTPDLGLDVLNALLGQYPKVHAFAMAGQGEPTLAREFASVARHLRENGKKLILDTNGVNSKYMEELTGCFARISLSLYGYDRKSFLRYAGVDGFNSVLASWEKYKKIASQTAITIIIDRDRPDELEKTLALCDSLSPDAVLLYNPLCYDPADAPQKAKIIQAKDADAILWIKELAKDRPYHVELPAFPDFERPLNSCRSYCEVINLDGEGNIGGCLRKVLPDKTFGNVFQDEDCFNTPAMSRLRRLQMVGRPAHAECRDCFGAWGHGSVHALNWKKEMASACPAR